MITHFKNGKRAFLTNRCPRQQPHKYHLNTGYPKQKEAFTAILYKKPKKASKNTNAIITHTLQTTFYQQYILLSYPLFSS